jgi:carboxymethylenebutenolidase
MTTTLELTAKDGFKFPAYVAAPLTPARGAVIVLQEIFGVNAHIQAVANFYSAHGYLAIAPAMFHRVKADVNLGYTGEDMGAGMGLKAGVEALVDPASATAQAPLPTVMQDIQAAIDHAHSATGGKKVAVVGFCWGGLLTWRAACALDGIAAAAPYYGGGVTVGAEPQRTPRCPVLAHFGERDKHITMDTVNAFTRAQPQVQVHVYAADHGFNCDHRGSFDASAAQLAQGRTLAFFAQHLA